MKVLFVSNYINHHQLPFSKAMLTHENVEYTFIQTEKMEEERVKMGWGLDVKELPFVKCFYDEPENCRQMIMDADVVIFGGTDDEDYIMPRLEAGKLTIRYSERIYKEGQWKFISPNGLKKKYHDHIRFRKSNVYMLCSGGYVASDFNLIHAYPDKLIKWGYFPEIKEYDLDAVRERKKLDDKSLNILWSGRMIDWKHPEHALEVAGYLSMLKEKQGMDIQYKLTMIGEGPLRENLEKVAKEKKLNVEFFDFMEPSKVREYMLDANIYLFTSDYKEGWGAVLNEALNSCCAVVASSGIGAVPFLLKDGKNGMVYKTGDALGLCQLVAKLVDDKSKCFELGKTGYEYVQEKWNAVIAANRLVIFMEKLLQGEYQLFEDDGPVSKAEIISPNKGYEYTKRQ